MSNFTVQRALLSAKWEIEPRYGLQSLARFLASRREDGGAAAAAAEDRRPALAYYDLHTRGRIVASAASGQAVGFEEAQAAGPGSLLAHVIMSGPMMMEGGMCSYGVRDTIGLLRAADSDERVAGVLFEIDSGGGESTSGTELQNALADMGKPVLVYTQLLASAALRAALAADAVYAAHASTEVGSVGSYVAFDREVLAEIQDTIGYIYAEQSTEKNAAFRALLEGDEAPMRQYVSAGAQAFIDDVERARPGMRRTSEQRAAMQAGRLFTAREAVQMGLIDGVATFGQALQLLSAAARREREAEVSAFQRNPQGTTMNNRPGIFRAVASMLGMGEVDVPSPSTTTPAADEATTQPQPPVENTNPTTPEKQEEGSPTAALTARVETLIQTVEAQATTIAALSEKLDQAATERAQQNQVIASLKAGNSAAETPNGRRADREQFATAARVDEKNQELASAGSKY